MKELFDINFQTYFIYLSMGPYLAQPVTQKAEKTGQSHKNNLRFHFSEMQGWRRNMEDAAICQVDIGQGNSLFAIFDGHGGPEVSKMVQKIFKETLLKSKHYQEKRYKEALQETFKQVDERIQSKSGQIELKQERKKNGGPQIGENRVCDNTGCTANVVLITPTKYIIGNAGDSRSVLCRGGRAIPLSFDHKPENPEEFKRITKAGGQVYNGRVNGGLNLSRSFGDFSYKLNGSKSYKQQLIICHPDIREQLRSPEDEYIVIGCDGIFERYVTDNQPLINRLCESRKYKVNGVTIMKNLLDDLLAKDTIEEIGCDNMTCMMIQFI